MTIHLTAEQEARLQQEAGRNGMDAETYVLRRLFGESLPIETDEAARLAAIDAAYGAFADVPFSSEVLMQEKREEVAREEARFREQFQ